MRFKFQKKGLSEGSQGKSLCIFTTESVRQVDRLEEDPPDPHNNSSRQISSGLGCLLVSLNQIQLGLDYCSWVEPDPE